MNPSTLASSSPPDFPSDIRKNWYNLIRRLQGTARTQQGLAAITITVFVNAEGDPIKWTSPRMTCLEPKGSDDQFLDFLGLL